NGTWHEWESWSACSVSCGGGSRNRTRSCYGPFFDGYPCEGPDSETGNCSAAPCPVDGEWMSWNSWEPCNVTCGNGNQVRSRECKEPQHGGALCIGDVTELRSCNPQPCPVDGYWLPWTEWDKCTHTCGSGSQRRARSCEPPLHGGRQCEGEEAESRQCNAEPCAVNGYWEQWAAWTNCSVSCGDGFQSRYRNCTPPRYGGAECIGKAQEERNCSTQPCPVNGYWEKWSAWTNCSVSCGGGLQSRYRNCTPPRYGGAECIGKAQEERNCSTHPCPVDGEWTSWSKWSECSATCGGGNQTRERACSQPLFGGIHCHGNSTEIRDCGLNPCPVDGVWEHWGEWQGCDLTCGGGKQRRRRRCIPGQHGGRDCDGLDEEIRDCNEMPCPAPGMWTVWSTWGSCDAMCNGGYQIRYRNCDATVGLCEGESQERRDCNVDPCPECIDSLLFFTTEDGVFMDWSTWSFCSASCGGGSQRRSRECDGPRYNGRNCTGPWEEEQPCNTRPCPVDGYLTQWLEWTECSVTCGGGSQERNRTCVEPQYGGQSCHGELHENRSCNIRNCPVDGFLTQWSEWRECNATCGGGSQERNRTCVEPQYGGQSCHNELREYRSCNEQQCPVNGYFTEWLEWTECSVTCGGGSQERNRTCVEPQYGGQSCHGEVHENRSCNILNCPVDGHLTQWSEWTECNVTCGGGSQERNRTCVEPKYGGKSCRGELRETKGCSDLPCPVDGFYTEWSPWSQCQVSCGGGHIVRTRTCQPPMHGGLPCQGAATERETCNEHPCPIHGYFTEWENWSNCNVTCAGGTRTRNRTCVGPFHGGDDCQGTWGEMELCNEQPCPIPEWTSWSSWSQCSKTCGVGVRYKTRSCTIYNKCEGNPVIHIKCNVFPCEPAISCDQWKKRGLSESTETFVDPDGPDGPLEQFPVFCNLTEDASYTVIGHDNEGENHIQGFEGAGEGFRYVTYNKASVQQVAKLVDVSQNCQQYLSWQCFGAAIHHPEKNMTLTYWLTRSLEMANYWSGASPGSGMCECGMTGSCVDNLKCHCDKNDETWREDSGLVTNRADLPITGVKIGDTGSSYQPAHHVQERGVLTIGKLICYG
ncbi:A disintegrin and metalloproteinase with thrombospondin motifs adt-1-like, partial [Lingula anatina]|uniref:A disintegrin and metalloproteinase with thrombospondin motifs adt-1-like n=1 Tax=Lingula anatina TaxID=7574 RepID=A0A1S3IAC8_LINAN